MLLLAVGLILGLTVGIQIGLYIHWITVKLNDIWNRDPEPPAQVITPKRPGYADVNELSAIVTPKTPDQIDREEQEAIRNL